MEISDGYQGGITQLLSAHTWDNRSVQHLHALPRPYIHIMVAACCAFAKLDREPHCLCMYANLSAERLRHFMLRPPEQQMCSHDLFSRLPIQSMMAGTDHTSY